MIIKQIFFFCISAISLHGMAAHFNGHEFTWHCIQTGPDEGKIVFEYHIYGRCDNSGAPSTAAFNNPLYGKWGGVSQYTVNLVSTVNSDTTCFSFSSDLCYPTSIYAMTDRKYLSNPVLLYGVPDSSGSNFIMSNCCGPTLVNATSSGTYLRSTMYPYKNPYTGVYDTLGTSNKPSCYDNSPDFVERPYYFRCLTYTQVLNYGAEDSDGDSLTYHWIAPMQSATQPVSFKGGFSVNAQLPSSQVDSRNIPAVLDTTTGRVTLKPYAYVGLYVTDVIVRSYRGGQLIAEVIRDINVWLLNCSTTVNNNNPDISFKPAASSGFNYKMNHIVYLGETVDIDVRVLDNDYKSGTTSFQTPDLRLSGNFAAENANDTINCLYPPCAYFDSSGNTFFNNGKFKAPGIVQVRFKWKPNCDHLLANNLPLGHVGRRIFTFYVNSHDNFCPLPGFDSKTFNVTVIDTSSNQYPLSLIEIRGNSVQLEWPAYTSADFSSYDLYRKDTVLLVWVPLTTIINPAAVSYPDILTSGYTQAIEYAVRLYKGPNCYDLDNYRSIYMDKQVYGIDVKLNWNSPRVNGTSYPNGRYYIERRDTSGPWYAIDSTAYDLNTYTDHFPNTGHWLFYRIHSVDAYGLTAISNKDSIFIDTSTVNPPPPSPPPPPPPASLPAPDSPSDPTPPNTGESEFGEKFELNVFPNPFRSELNFTFSGSVNGCALEVIDLHGRLRIQTVLNGKNENLDVSGLRPGLYFLRFTDESGRVIYRKVSKVD